MTAACVRVVQDYFTCYLGSSLFKITRLLCYVVAMIHLCACFFWRVKVATFLTLKAGFLFGPSVSTVGPLVLLALDVRVTS